MKEQDIQNAIGGPLYGSDGAKIGKVSQVYLDDVTGQPEWVTVSTGLFGGKENFVPVAQSEFTDDGLRVAYDKDTVQNAPRIDADGHLSPDQEGDLYRHYGLDYAQDQSPSGQGERTDRDGVFDDAEGKTVGQDTSGPATDEAMTRSEEQLHVGTEKVAAGKARLRKYVVTEQQNVTVPVTREEVRLEREPITESNRPAAMDGPSISEEEHEVVLTEERVVVNKETVPVERVRMGVEEVTEEKQVTEEVRKEQIEAEGNVKQ